MTDWIHERGIGEARAALIEDDVILEAAIEVDGGPRAGAVLAARFVRALVPGHRGLVVFDGGEALLEPLPQGLSEGRTLLIEILREAIAEPGHAKRAVARPASDGAAPAPGPALRERLAATGLPVIDASPFGPDLLERAGWSELLEEAGSGEIAFRGGALRLSLTPAMTLFDVDGVLPPPALAVAGADAAARSILRMDIGGSIGIDLPTVAGKADRQAAAAAVDAILPQPFERTAVNGFGFLQIVRRRTRASLPELLRYDRMGAAARALLRLATRAPGAGTRRLIAAPAVIERIAAEPRWVAELQRVAASPVALQAEPGLAISAGHVHVVPL